MKSNVIAREEEVRRFPGRYVDSVKSPNGRVLRSNCEIRDAFQAHFCNRFVRYPDLPLQKFCSYLADFPCFRATEAAGCEGVVTECEVRDTLKQVDLNKSPALDGLPYEMFLRLPSGYVQPLVRPGSHPW